MVQQAREFPVVSLPEIASQLDRDDVPDRGEVVDYGVEAAGARGVGALAVVDVARPVQREFCPLQTERGELFGGLTVQERAVGHQGETVFHSVAAGSLQKGDGYPADQLQ